MRERMLDLAWIDVAPSLPWVLDLKSPVGPERLDGLLYECDPIDPPEE